MIVKNRLLNFDNKIIYQDDECFSFSIDSVLLSNFVSLKLTDKVIVDFCSGNAPIPMLLSFRTKAKITGIEIQKKIYEMGYNSIQENNMLEQVSIINDDIKNVSNYFSSETVDIVTCNPPYFKYLDSSLINYNYSKSVARHEILLKLDDVLESAAYILKNGGTFAMVHRVERFIEIIDLMRKYHIEPKKVQFIYPKSGKECNIVLIEGTKNGKNGLKMLSPLFIYDDNGNYTSEIKNMFGGV